MYATNPWTTTHRKQVYEAWLDLKKNYIKVNRKVGSTANQSFSVCARNAKLNNAYTQYVHFKIPKETSELFYSLPDGRDSLRLLRQAIRRHVCVWCNSRFHELRAAEAATFPFQRL